MDVFKQSTVIDAAHRFRRPSIVTVHHVEVLYHDGSVSYFDCLGGLSARRDDVQEFLEINDAQMVALMFELQGLNASVETSQRIMN